METINEYLEQSQELSKKEKIEKRKMTVSLMGYLVEYNGDAYKLEIQPSKNLVNNLHSPAPRSSSESGVGVVKNLKNTSYEKGNIQN